MRDAAEASTMIVFSFGLVPAQAFRAQEFRNGATDPKRQKPTHKLRFRCEQVFVFKA